MMALFLMCLIGFSGTALLAFKKSRDKPVGYTVLATGDHELKNIPCTFTGLDEIYKS